MGLMGHDACGLCQGDHHYTAHPDWRALFEGGVTLTGRAVILGGLAGATFVILFVTLGLAFSFLH